MAYEDNEIDIYDADENTDTIWPVKIIKLILMMPAKIPTLYDMIWIMKITKLILMMPTKIPTLYGL